MPTPPDRYKPPTEYDVNELAQEMTAKLRGESLKIETEEYRRYRADALRAAGLTDEADASEPHREPAPEDLSTGEHFERLRQP